MSYYDPDYTGQHPAHLVENDVFGIHKDGQKIYFENPIFEESILIHILDSINTPFLKDVDWKIDTSDIDDNAMSRALLFDKSFDKKLIKSITVLKPYTHNYFINIKHQTLYPVAVKKALLHGRRIEFTPDLLGAMIEDIDKLKALTNPIEDVHATNDNAPIILKEDPFKENKRNFIAKEKHNVNTLEKRSFIRPLAGSFFKDSVEVRIKDDPNPLVVDKDYIILGLDIHKMHVTNNTSGVYKFIKILREYVGDVFIGYHGYGGDPTLADVESLHKRLNNLLEYIQDSKFLTKSTLGKAPVIESIILSLNNLEEKMRNLVNGASYGDVTHGGAIRKKITTSDDDLHWYTVASLYKVDGSESIITTDRFKFRFQSNHTDIMFDAIVSVNLNNETEKLKVSVQSDHYPKGYIPYVNHDNINKIILPQLRIIYNESNVQKSGVLLQIGLALKGFTEDTIAIEDLSGKESCWKLVKGDAEAIQPEDDIVELPANGHIFDLANAHSKAISTLVPFKDGYLAYAGAIPLNRPTGGRKDFELNHIIPDYVDLTRISRAKIEVKETDGYKYPIEINFTPGSEDMVGVGHFLYNSEPCYVNLRIWRDTGKDIKMMVMSDVAHAAAHLDLTYVHLFT